MQQYAGWEILGSMMISQMPVSVPYEYWEQGRSICKPSHLTYGEIRTNENS